MLAFRRNARSSVDDGCSYKCCWFKAVGKSNVINRFIQAASRGDLEEVNNLLFLYGESIVNARDNDGDTALLATIDGETTEAVEVVKSLLKNGATVDSNAIGKAEDRCQHEIASLLRQRLDEQRSQAIWIL